MKNRKKIFIFFLLLCTIFSTLIIVRPKVKAQSTDLIDTTWYFNSTLDLSFFGSDSFPYFEYSFTVDTDTQYLGMGVNDGSLVYIDSFDSPFAPTWSGDTVYIVGDGWINDIYRRISFTNSITDSTFISFITENATQVLPSNGYNVTLEQGSNSLDFNLFAVGEVLYQINESGYNVPIYTSQTPLPYTIENVENIKFINNSTDYRLLVYQNEQTYSVIEPGNQSLLYSITSDKTIDLELVSIEPEVTTYTISGGYMFNPTISSSIFGDYTEQLIDIRLLNNFYLYDLRLLPFNQFSIYSDIENPNILYFTYVYVPEERTTYAGTFTNNGNIITNVAQRTIYFEEQEVSEEVYNWLTNNGRFGNFDNTLPEPSPDNPFGFVVDMVNDFLQIEFLPGFRLIHLLYIGVSIPLCIFILKLFLGG